MKKNKRLFQVIFTGGIYSTTIPLLIISIFLSFFLFNYFSQDIYRHNLLLSKTIASRIDDLLNDPERTLQKVKIILDSDQITDHKPAEISKLLTDISSSEGYFENIEVLDTEGKVLYTLTDYTYQLGFDRSSESYFKQVVDTKSVYISRVQISNTDAQPTLVIAIPAGNRIIVGFLNFGFINVVSDQLKSFSSVDVDVSVTDSYGFYIISSDPQNVTQHRIDPNFEAIKSKLDAGIQHFDLTYNHKDNLMTTTLIERLNWYVSVAESRGKAYQVLLTMLGFIFGFLILSMIGSIIITLANTRKITKDVSKFIRKTELIANGITISPALLVTDYVEFQKLAEQFEVMIKSIHTRDLQLENLAYHDSLTKLFSRAYLYKNPINFFLINNNDSLGLLYLDIDNFKNVNDTYGHIFGDRLLIQFSKRLQEILSETTILARIGGDEFVILVPDLPTLGRIDSLLNDLISFFKTPLIIDDHPIYITASIGVSLYPKDGSDFNALLRCADSAMYEAKSQGKNLFFFYSNDMKSRIEHRVSIEQNLRTALALDEFFLEYQVQVDAISTKVRGFEALIRWRSSVLGLQNPMEFISIAEETRYIIHIGEWVLRRSCQDVKRINQQLNQNYILAINASPIEIQHPNYVSTLQKIITETGIDPTWIEIEITENVPIETMEQIVKTLIKLREIGIRISMDDFGTGYSSLSYINLIPLDILKIDRQFITNLTEKDATLSLCEMIIRLSHETGLRVVAEGVETQAQLDILRNLNCDYIQGFLISRPIAVEALLKYLIENECNCV